MSKYGALINEARKPENQKTRKLDLEDSIGAKPEVNLSIKVAASRRRHWAAEAKRRGTTLTATIIEALSEKFGEPE